VMNAWEQKPIGQEEAPAAGNDGDSNKPAPSNGTNG
jgi:hypothetical protein